MHKATLSMRAQVFPLLIANVMLSSTAPQVTGQETSEAERDSMYYRYLQWPSLVRNWRITPRWMADGTRFSYQVEVNGDTVTYLVDPEANTQTPTESPSPGELTERNPDAGAPGAPVSPDGSLVAEVRGHDLWLRSTSDGSLVRVTTDGTKEYGWTIGGFDEWTFLAGGHGPHVAWSPDGTKLAVKKMDRRGVDSIPLDDWLGERVQSEWVYYARAGRPIAQEELWVIDVRTGDARRIDSGAQRDLQLPILGWSPDGTVLYFMRGTRDHKKREVVAADMATGSLRTLLSESSPTWVRLAARSFWLLADGQRFLWLSERDGWNHLYLYETDGTLIRQLTSGDFPVSSVLATDEEAGWVYLLALGDRDRPYDLHLYRVHLDGHGFQQLTEATGRHTIQLSPSRTFFLDRHSTIGRPPVTELRRADGTYLRTLTEANTDALAALQFVPGEEFVVKAGDGETDLWGAMYRPYDFDSTARYPVVEYIGEGPIETEVRRQFIHNQIFQAWAQLGFIVYIVDGRGTAERGKAFQDVRYGNWGRYEIAEHVSVLRQLAAQRPYMDLDRVGIVGYSWGGYYALRALLTARDVYHVGVAVEPDPELTEIFWDASEPYMGPPEENADAWEAASNIALVDSLSGRLLLVQGTNDRKGPMHGTMMMTDALIRAGKVFDMLVVPGMGHVVRTSPRYAWRYAWGEAIPRFLQEHLQP